jgi:putative membrane protein
MRVCYASLLSAGVFAAFALAAPWQSGTAERIANPEQITSDSDFMQKSAEDMAYLEAVSAWAKDHGTHVVRYPARDLLFDQGQLGASLAKLAKNKHIDAELKLNDLDKHKRAQMEGMNAGQVDRFFLNEELQRYGQLVALLQAESQQGQDPDIKRWASDNIKTLQQQQEIIHKKVQPRVK